MLHKQPLLTALAGLMFPVAIMAANVTSPPPEQATKPHGEHLAKALGLSPDQTTKFEQMFDQHKAAVKAERQRFESQVNTILTPEQQAKFKELTTKRAEMRKEAFARHHEGFMMALDKLNLSPDQKAEVKKIMADKRAKLAAVAPGDFAARKQIWQETRAKIEKVLTPDQLKQWNQMKEEWKARHHNEVCGSPQGE